VISHTVLFLVLTLVGCEHLLKPGHLLSKLYVLWCHARGVATKILTVGDTLTGVKCSLGLQNSHLFGCHVLTHLTGALHHHAIWCILCHADVGTTWLHHARRL
jgi:hypothetical protein